MQMETQQLGNWCWAAVSVSVDKYFNPASTRTQCQVASAVTGTATCCSTPGPCNTVERLDTALTVVARLKTTLLRPLAAPEIQSEIAAFRPVCVRIGWADGGGHFVAVDGIGRSPSGETIVHVVDPLFDDSVVTLDELLSAYQGSGQWTSTFFVI
jgi:hypothetical protein